MIFFSLSCSFPYKDSTVGPLSTTTDRPPTNASVIPQRSDIQCGSAYISVNLPVSLLGAGNFTLQDPQCSIQPSNGHLAIQFGLAECGTQAHFTQDAIVYKNFINNLSDGQSIPIECLYPRRKSVSISYRPVQRHVRFFEKNLGTMDITMRQFTSETFMEEIPTSSYPVNVKLHEPVYLQVEATSLRGSPLVVFPASCIATDSANPQDSSKSRDLISHGCKLDPSVVVYPANGGQLWFSFNAFPLSPDTSVVYVHCEILLCNGLDLTSECKYGCTDRAKRAAATPARDGHFVSGGPLVLDDDSSSKDSSMVPILVAVAAVSMVVALVAVTVAVVSLRAKRAK